MSPAIMEFCASGFLKKGEMSHVYGELDRSWKKNRMSELLITFCFLLREIKSVEKDTILTLKF